MTELWVTLLKEAIGVPTEDIFKSIPVRGIRFDEAFNAYTLSRIDGQ